MSFGSRLTAIRKDHKISQGELAQKAGIHSNVLGRYERGEATPSVEMAMKIADALTVTLDYLVKDAEYEQIDNDTLKRLKEVQGLDAENRSHVFATIDAFIKAAKLKSIAAM